VDDRRVDFQYLFSVANGAQVGFRGHRRAVASRLGTQVVPDLHCTVSLGYLVLFWSCFGMYAQTVSLFQSGG
jgi:hypothetical protein